jgi:transcriptional regulator with XRE-family HTH domain
MTADDNLAGAAADPRALAEAGLRDCVLRLLHEALERSDMTQVDLADKLGVRRSAVNQVLKGDGNMHVARLAAYLHALGFTLDLAIVPLDAAQERVRPGDDGLPTAGTSPREGSRRGKRRRPGRTSAVASAPEPESHESKADASPHAA